MTLDENNWSSSGDAAPSAAGLLREDRQLDGATAASGTLVRPVRLPRDDYERCRRDLVLPLPIRLAYVRYLDTVVKAWESGIIDCPLAYVLLLEGDPGTGKTMAAMALAQYIARWNETRTGRPTFAFHVRAPALFSELLGQSVRAVEQLFEDVESFAEQGPSVVILDELEAVGISRTRIGSADPTEVVRVIDELLRGLDALRGRRNFVLVGTTNVVGLIDGAIVDRADLVLHFDRPHVEAATAILRRAASAALRLGIYVGEADIRMAAVALCGDGDGRRPSGRLLSKLPFLTYMYGASAHLSADAMVDMARQAMAQEGP